MPGRNIRLFIGFIAPITLGTFLFAFPHLPHPGLFVAAIYFVGVQSVLYSLIVEFWINRRVHFLSHSVLAFTILGLLSTLPWGLFWGVEFAINGAVVGLVVGLGLRTLMLNSAMNKTGRSQST